MKMCGMHVAMALWQAKVLWLSSCVGYAQKRHPCMLGTQRGNRAYIAAVHVASDDVSTAGLLL